METLIRFIQDYCAKHDDEFQQWKKEQEAKREKDCS